MVKDSLIENFAVVCAGNGFRFERHQIETEDGYLLEQFRIPGMIGEDESKDRLKKPILFQHGIVDSAWTWIQNRPDIAPAFVAALAGYDVWLGNSRGNTFSLDFVSPVTQETYWDFDWEQMGRYDVPATFDYITHINGHQKIAYVGHSMGTTQMFYALAKIPDFFRDRMSLFVALAPVTTVQTI